MKIAFPTNDRINIATRTGRCKEFAIADINHDNVKYTYILNPHEHNHNHHDEKEHSHSHSDLVKVLDGIDALYVLNVGKNMMRDLENGHIPYIKVEEENISEIVNNLKKDI